MSPLARTLASTLAAFAVVSALVGCARSPEPTPTPTGFASEAEAFEAAEATYRAYVDALNEVDLSDPETFEPVFALTTGDSLANEKTTLTRMHADGWEVSGATTISEIRGSSWSADIIEIQVCSNVSAVDVRDSSGNSVVPTNRPDEYSLSVILEGTSSENLLIASSDTEASEICD